MATVTFKFSSALKHAHTMTNPVSHQENNSSSKNNSKLYDSINQYALPALNQKQKKSKLYFPSKDASNGDSSIEFHEKYNDIAKPSSQSEDENKTAPRLKFNTNELSISSIYEEEKRAKLLNANLKKIPNKNPLVKSEFKSFKKYTYKALNQPEEINHNLNILGDISDSDDTLTNNQKEKEVKAQAIPAEPQPKYHQEESDLDCDVIDEDDDSTVNENAKEDISSKVTRYQTMTIPSSQFGTGVINYKNLLTKYYNGTDEIDMVPEDKIEEMQKNLVEIDKYRRSIEESKELIHKLKNQLENQSTVNQINQSSLPFLGKLPDEDHLLCELTQLKTRYNTKTEKFKVIVQKLKNAITQSTSTSL